MYKEIDLIEVRFWVGRKVQAWVSKSGGKNSIYMLQNNDGRIRLQPIVLTEKEWNSLLSKKNEIQKMFLRLQGKGVLIETRFWIGRKKQACICKFEGKSSIHMYQDDDSRICRRVISLTEKEWNSLLLKKNDIKKMFAQLEWRKKTVL